MRSASAVCCVALAACGGPPTEGPVDDDPTDVVGTDTDGRAAHTGTLPEDTGRDTALDGDDDGVPRASDCDDTDPDVHPFAEETCRNGIDDDCDPTTDCRWSGFKVEPKGMVEGRVGASVAIGDLTGDGLADVVASGVEVDLTPSPVNVVFVLEDLADDTVERIASVAFATDLEPAAVGLGDLTADGAADLVVGGLDGGWLLPGPATASVDLRTDATPLRFPDPGRAESFAIGDEDGDGDMDLLVGKPSIPGRVYLLHGPLDPPSPAGGSTFRSAIGEHQDFGTAVALADLAGDGAADVVYVTPGEALVFDGPVAPGVHEDADRRVVDPGIAVAGTDPNRRLATADLDGDGYDDLILGLDDSGFAAEAVVEHGPVEGDLTAADAEVVVVLPVYGEGALGVQTGDFDGDGAVDLVIQGCPLVDVLYGPVGTGVVDLGTVVHPVLSVSEPGWLVAGDVDDDGFDELVLGLDGASGLMYFLGSGE